MGSRGRRAAESRVGDEEMEEEKLYTKSKKDKYSVKKIEQRNSGKKYGSILYLR